MWLPAPENAVTSGLRALEWNARTIVPGSEATGMGVSGLTPEQQRSGLTPAEEQQYRTTIRNYDNARTGWYVFGVLAVGASVGLGVWIDKRRKR